MKQIQVFSVEKAAWMNSFYSLMENVEEYFPHPSAFFCLSCKSLIALCSGIALGCL